MRLPFALPDRRRTVSFVLALVVEALLILVLLTFGPRFGPAAPRPDRHTTSFSLTPAPEEAATSPDRRATTKAKAKASSARTPTRSRRAPVPATIAPVPNVPVPTNSLSGVLPIQLGAKDISKLQSSAQPDADPSNQPDSKLAYGPGEGPGGESLYPEDWYREPRPAELDGYLPRTLPPHSYVVIACRTIPNYRVDNCRTLTEAPPGTGLGRAMRQAAWQFQIRPPRRGGKALIGVWVRILIDYRMITGRADDTTEGTSGQ